jgi:hypothetical protein
MTIGMARLAATRLIEHEQQRGVHPCDGRLRLQGAQRQAQREGEGGRPVPSLPRGHLMQGRAGQHGIGQGGAKGEAMGSGRQAVLRAKAGPRLVPWRSSRRRLDARHEAAQLLKAALPKRRRPNRRRRKVRSDGGWLRRL